jgi:hypothetical protein
MPTIADTALLADLHELIALAEQDQLVSVVCSAQKRGGTTKTIYSTLDAYIAIGQLEEMKFRLLQALGEPT